MSRTREARTARPARTRCTAVALVLATAMHANAHAAQPEAAPQATSSPSEDPLGPDEVTLRDGGFVRGTLVEVSRQSHVVIVLGGSDERRRIAHEDIERIERGKHTDDEARGPAGSAAASTTEREPTSTEKPPAARGKPRVHLEVAGGKDVHLFEIGEEIRGGGPYGPSYGMRYRSICSAPCGRVVDGSSGSSFFLGQDIWTASRRFELAEYTGDLTIRVRPGNRTLRIVGGVLLGLGIGAAIAGGVFVFGETTRRTGLGLLASGGVSIGIGTPLLLLGRTRHEIVSPQK
jgi:hypothetical protein